MNPSPSFLVVYAITDPYILTTCWAWVLISRRNACARKVLKPTRTLEWYIISCCFRPILKESPRCALIHTYPLFDLSSPLPAVLHPHFLLSSYILKVRCYNRNFFLALRCLWNPQVCPRLLVFVVILVLVISAVFVRVPSGYIFLWYRAR